MELEPMLRRFDEINVLEAVLEVKKSKVSQCETAQDTGHKENNLAGYVWQCKYVCQYTYRVPSHSV